MTGVVMRLREALEPELTRLIDTARTVQPDVDGATVGSLLTLYGIEIGLTAGGVGRATMAAYLKEIASALEGEADALPTLSRIVDPEASEPSF